MLNSNEFYADFASPTYYIAFEHSHPAHALAASGEASHSRSW
jgi:hypothetical protein